MFDSSYDDILEERERDKELPVLSVHQKKPLDLEKEGSSSQRSTEAQRQIPVMRQQSAVRKPQLTAPICASTRISQDLSFHRSNHSASSGSWDELRKVSLRSFSFCASPATAAYDALRPTVLSTPSSLKEQPSLDKSSSRKKALIFPQSATPLAQGQLFAGSAPSPFCFGAPPAGSAPSPAGFGASPSAPSTFGFGASSAGSAPSPASFGTLFGSFPAPPAAAHHISLKPTVAGIAPPAQSLSDYEGLDSPSVLTSGPRTASIFTALACKENATPFSREAPLTHVESECFASQEEELSALQRNEGQTMWHHVPESPQNFSFHRQGRISAPTPLPEMGSIKLSRLKARPQRLSQAHLSPGFMGARPPPPSGFTGAPPPPPSGFTGAPPPPPSGFTGAPPPPPPSGFTGAPPPPPSGFTGAPPPPPSGFTGAPPPPPSGFTGAPPPPPSGFTGAPPPPPSGFTGAPPPPPSGFTGAPPPPSGFTGAPPPPRPMLKRAPYLPAIIGAPTLAGPVASDAPVLRRRYSSARAFSSNQMVSLFGQAYEPQSHHPSFEGPDPDEQKLKWIQIFQLQQADGYWELTVELGKLINVDVDVFVEKHLKKKGIHSLGSKVNEGIRRLVATLLVLQLMREEKLEEGKLLQSLFDLKEPTGSRSERWQQVKKAVDWVRWADREYPCAYSRLEFGWSWESSTRQLLGFERFPPFSPLISLELQKTAAPLAVH
ncbi:uncharacterized protein LOC129374531 [Poeciliopsis prolifica]|uniref:uncharacterized protein LOC129374531 n=1 Tax=Poeciliopsis prolifica TaxID=188132 RepID=UPI00241319F7|nr:uncharacterized protein LOC129374531 [Poeciliopsis prolifica]